MKTEPMFTPAMSNIASASAPFPANQEMSDAKRNRTHVQQDWNNTRKSVSAGAVICSHPQQLFPTASNPMMEGQQSFGFPRFAQTAENTHKDQFNKFNPRIPIIPMEYPTPPKSPCYNQCSDEHIAWLGEPIDETLSGMQATRFGFISLNLHSDVRVDVTIDNAIRIICNSKGIIVSLNANGNLASMIHPSGKIYQYGSRVEVTTTDPRGNSKYAKMWHRGVSFSSEHSALTYLVDSAGTRTTTDTFSDTYGDISLPIFLDDSKHGRQYVRECSQLIRQTEYWVSKEGIENWSVNGTIRISQTVDGLVRVSRGGKYILRVSPMSQTASLTTPCVHATASVGSGRDCHIFVKRGERRMHYDGNTFIVRNGTHSAGFDEKSQLKVY